MCFGFAALLVQIGARWIVWRWLVTWFGFSEACFGCRCCCWVWAPVAVWFVVGWNAIVFVGD